MTNDGVTITVVIPLVEGLSRTMATGEVSKNVACGCFLVIIILNIAVIYIKY